MKALVYAGDGALNFIRMGYMNAMSSIGISCIMWHPRSGKPLFDVFDETSPDLVLCGSYEIDRALIKNLLKRPEIKVILWGGNWGDMDKEIDRSIDPVLMISEEEKQFLPALIKNNNIKHVFTYYSQRCAESTHNHWRNLGLEPKGLLLAADTTQYKPTTPNDSLICDLSFIGGYWPYKAISFNKYLIPMCYKSDINIKIFGYGNWPVAQYLGSLPANMLPNLFSSSTVNASIFEPLSAKYGFDVNERPYKILASGGFCVSEYCESAAKDVFVNNEVVFANNPDDFREKVYYYIKNPEERQSFIERGLNTIKHKHTYFHRLADLISYTNIPLGEEKDRLQKIIEGLKND